MAVRSMVSLALVAILLGCGEDDAGSERAAALEEGAARVPIDSGGIDVEAEVKKDVPYVPTPQSTVDEMLRMAKVTPDDVVYDLGSGDGRIVITAAKSFGARGVGIEIDPRLVAEATANARAAGVGDRVEFIQEDLYQADFSKATAVTLYLFPIVNFRLRPRLLAELRPGTPVVSYKFDMSGWEPDGQKEVDGSQVYLWIIPAKADGEWSWTTADGQRRTGVLRQEFQKLAGEVEGGDGTLTVRNGRVNGREVSFELTRGTTADAPVVERYRGQLNGGSITGNAEAGERRSSWLARR